MSLLQVALSAKLRLLLTAVAATALAFAALTQVTPTYEADSQVLLEAAAAPVIDIPNAVPEAPDGIATLESAIIMMRSPEIMRAVADELDLVERAEFNSALRDPTPVDRLRGAVSGLIDQLTGTAEPEDDTPSDPLARTARSLRDAVSVRSIGESRVIEISTTSESARLAAAISNSVARHYIERQVEVKREAAERATAWLEERAAELRAQLEDNEAQLSSVRREMIEAGRAVSGDLEAQLAELTTQMVQLTKQRGDLSAQRAEISQLREAENYATLATAAAQPTLTALVERLAQTDSRIVELQAEYGDHPQTRATQEARRQLVSLLESETGRLVSGLDVRIGVVEDRLTKLEADIRDTRGALVDSRQDDLRLAALQREVEASRNVYERFLLRQKEARERSQFQSPGARLVAEADKPSNPVAPQKAKLAVLAGIGAATAMLLYLAFLRTPKGPRADPVDPAELREFGALVPLPRVGPVRKPQDILKFVRDTPDADLGVALRWFQLYLMPKSKDWSTLIMVTSPEEGDGKSTLSLLLAETFSRNYSTTLVNADEDGWLSDFARTKEFKRSGFGFVDYSEEVLDLIETEVAIESNLRDRKDALLGADVIIVDAPAMPMSAGLLEIGQLADYTVVTCAWNRSRQASVLQCLQALNEVGIAVSAFALNIMPRDALAPLSRLPRADRPGLPASGKA
ncbi:hypothetical protein Salmuc_00573 [Salipiger mucosus DSM 16094]|uniref:Tyrosine-protein kinase G-rich domain-containing protein n=1 Tax=Salipiger mucosus DSM 16094 TaxID=1123237 RepID=S9QUC4_9RHOB|nr:hypothetical protein Salmuc_00573 [Salipiger mucosus DSM 16094]